MTDGWMYEMANFFPKLRVLSYTGEKERRRNIYRKIYEHVNKEVSDVCASHIISVSSLRNDISVASFYPTLAHYVTFMLEIAL